jgi:hypothetical protein
MAFCCSGVIQFETIALVIKLKFRASRLGFDLRRIGSLAHFYVQKFSIVIQLIAPTNVAFLSSRRHSIRTRAALGHYDLRLKYARAGS